MKASLLRWIGDADALRHMNQFGVREIPLALGYQQTRRDDLYIALVGELFDRMREDNNNPSDWARLGNAFAQYGVPDRSEELRKIGVSQSEAILFASASFYLGGFPASAYLTMRSIKGKLEGVTYRACFDLLARPKDIISDMMKTLLSSLLQGDLESIAAIETRVQELSKTALSIGPDEWIPLHLLHKLLANFNRSNLRAVLPDGSSPFWTPLITSLVSRGTWDFFPSQIEAIQRGLLSREETFSLQMPTGAGKTALCETLLFSHLSRKPDAAAVLLVPYRSLASELRNTLVKRLNEMGVSSRCAYGGTVPSGDEVRAFDETRALVATPESLSGILSANTSFARRVSLIICDEGHLLDAPSRGVGLELLLARMKTGDAGTRRFVFMSAIVPNIEEINLWLGGTETSVVRSDYRPALAEFAVLREVGQGTASHLDLEMYPHETEPIRYKIEQFLRRDDFQWRNPATGRMNSYHYSSVKTRAIAAARKTLPMGAAVVFAANKRGNQGAIGLANELLKQMEINLPLPNPITYASQQDLNKVTDYLEGEYGADWVGTLTLKVGAVLHHGDIPQETREVVERMLREHKVAMGICTSTLAEGVNFPIRTLVLYSVQRLGMQGARENLLTRDIKNLVGRAGRAGATTKGLVICANEDQWPQVAAVAQQEAGEHVVGALRSLIESVRSQIAINHLQLTNDLLERSPVVHSLIDGIDATLVDLAAEEIGEEELARIATDLADQTFAARQTDAASKQLLRDVFKLRAQRVSAIRTAQRLAWIKETGTRTRMLNIVETSLLPLRPRWDNVENPVDADFVNQLLDWSWGQQEMKQAVREAYQVRAEDDIVSVRDSFFAAIRLWLSGAEFKHMAREANLAVDDMLRVYSQVISFTMQTLIEQAVVLLEKLLQSQDQTIASAVLQFSEHLRFGVPTAAGCILANNGIRHRRAYVALGNAPELRTMGIDDKSRIIAVAKELLIQNQNAWQDRLGSLVAENTRRDLSIRSRTN